MTFWLAQGNCLDVMRHMADSSVDSVVTDPPYGLEFMGKGWDNDCPPAEIWSECLRVLKPGGWLLSFAGTRTQHRMATNIEAGGFEIRDMIAWVYGSGFPKSKNLDGDWKGWGTAFKPALEPITVARKPLAGTVAKNVMEHGTGALNIDACRVPHGDEAIGAGSKSMASWRRAEGRTDLPEQPNAERDPTLGRWPANLIHDGSDEVLACFPDSKGQQGAVSGNEPSDMTKYIYGKFNGRVSAPVRGDTGSAARFFYCAKASKADRNDGVDGKNTHPTVKPTDLMRYLCRLVTPPGGLVLDPFMGSGSTGRGAVLESFHFVGIEQDPSYMELAKSRIAKAAK